MSEEELKNSFRVTCECGSTLCSKQAISRHLKPENTEYLLVK